MRQPNVVAAASPDTVYQQPKVTQSESKRSPMVIIAAGAAAVFVLIVAIVGIGMWAMSNAAVTSNVAGGQKTTNTNSSQSTLKGGTQRVRVDLDEGKAQVIRNGQVLGTTPLDMDLAIGEKPDLTLHRDGYEDKTVQIEVGSGKKVFTFALKPKY